MGQDVPAPGLEISSLQGSAQLSLYPEETETQMVYWHTILCVVLGGSLEVGVTVSHKTRGELCPGSGVTAFLAPGTCIVEDNLFTAGVLGGVWFKW